MDYLTILLRTVLAVALGGAIGVERESKHRPAGFRTHTLVCVGASTVMVLSELLFARYNAAYGVMPDPARMPAQVISGIGFLGAGTIMRYGANVRGLTTAASIWATGCIGLAAGAGFYALAVTVTAVMLFTLVVFNRLSRFFEKKLITRDLMVEMRDDAQVLGTVTMFFAHECGKILSVMDMDSAEDGAVEEKIRLRHMVFVIQLRPGMRLAELVTMASALAGVTRVEVLS